MKAAGRVSIARDEVLEIALDLGLGQGSDHLPAIITDDLRFVVVQAHDETTRAVRIGDGCVRDDRNSGVKLVLGHVPQCNRVTNDEAWRVLEDALNRCGAEDDLQTPEVFEALKHLSAQAQAVLGGKGIHWPFRNFWKEMGAKKDVTFRSEGRWQQANAALRGMRLRVPEGLQAPP